MIGLDEKRMPRLTFVCKQGMDNLSRFCTTVLCCPEADIRGVRSPSLFQKSHCEVVCGGIVK